MRSGLGWWCACLVACGGSRDIGPPSQSSVSVAAVTPPPSVVAGPLELDPGEALARSATDGEIVVRTDVLRGHPVGARLGPILETWPGWRATLHAIANDPVLDLDWIDITGPSDAKQGRLLARTAITADAALDGRLVALQARSAEPSTGHVVTGVSAAAARLDDTLRVVFRAQPRFVAATPASRGPAISGVLVRARVRDPSTAALEAVRADVPEPHDVVRAVPEGIRRMKAHVFALASGDADATADGECATPDDAKRAAATLEEAIARQNSPLARMLTHGLLDAIVVDAEGSTVKIRLHATRDQLDAIVGLVSAIAGTGAP